MKVLLINGSARVQDTDAALRYVGKALESQGLEWEIYQIPNNQHGCLHCHWCHVDNHVGCVYDDDGVNYLNSRMKEFDGIVFSTPVYGGPSGSLKAFMQRLSFSNYPGNGNDFEAMGAGTVITARRYAISQSFLDIGLEVGFWHGVVIGSSGIPCVHGSQKTAEAVKLDKEGIQALTNLGLNMAYYLKMRKNAEEHGVKFPTFKKKIYTDFARYDSYYKG